MSNIFKKKNASNSKNEFICHKNISNSSNNMIGGDYKIISKHKSDIIYNYKSAHKKILNLTHRTDNSIQQVLKNIIKKI